MEDLVTHTEPSREVDAVAVAFANASPDDVSHATCREAMLPVHEVLDVIYLREDRITTVPSALRASEEMLKGAAPYREGLLGILDLHRVLTDGALVVDEEP